MNNVTQMPLASISNQSAECSTKWCRGIAGDHGTPGDHEPHWMRMGEPEPLGNLAIMGLSSIGSGPLKLWVRLNVDEVFTALDLNQLADQLERTSHHIRTQAKRLDRVNGGAQ